jgi:hypothetical protein
MNDWLAEQMGTDECFTCGKRRSCDKILACEQAGPGREGCLER